MEEKRELTKEQQEKLDEYIKIQKELEEKKEKVGKQINQILEENGLMTIVDHYIRIVPKQK